MKPREKANVPTLKPVLFEDWEEGVLSELFLHFKRSCLNPGEIYPAESQVPSGAILLAFFMEARGGRFYVQ